MNFVAAEKGLECVIVSLRLFNLFLMNITMRCYKKFGKSNNNIILRRNLIFWRI